MLLDNCREILWLLNNSLATNSQKLLRVRKLYKRLFPVSWTFSITRFSTFIRKTEFFNSHKISQHLSGFFPITGSKNRSPRSERARKICQRIRTEGTRRRDKICAFRASEEY